MPTPLNDYQGQNERNVARLSSAAKFIAVMILILTFGGGILLSVNGNRLSQAETCAPATYHQIDRTRIVTACGDTLTRDEKSFIRDL